jgi:hypothetical protein
MPLGAALVAALIVLVLSGCGSPAPVSTATKPPPATAAPAAGSTLAPAPAPTAPAVDPSNYTSAALNGVQFQTTDGNILCVISDSTTGSSTTGSSPSASCSIAQKDFAFPPQTAGTPSGVAVSGTTKAEAIVTDPVAVGAKSLPEDSSITWSTITCLAIENGIHCTNSASTHGFFLSRIKYQLF